MRQLKANVLTTRNGRSEKKLEYASERTTNVFLFFNKKSDDLVAGDGPSERGFKYDIIRGSMNFANHVTIEIRRVPDWSSVNCRGALHMALCRVAPCAMQTGTLHRALSPRIHPTACPVLGCSEHLASNNLHRPQILTPPPLYSVM